jgi:hypothetical protein
MVQLMVGSETTARRNINYGLGKTIVVSYTIGCASMRYNTYTGELILFSTIGRLEVVERE